MHKDLGMTPYKVQLVQELKRFRFAQWVFIRLTEDADFGKQIIFSDEAHFDLGVNKQNYRLCGTENLHANITLHTNESLFGADSGIIGPFFSKISEEKRSLSAHVDRIFVHKN